MTSRGTGRLSLNGKTILAAVGYEISEEGPRPGSVMNRITGRLLIDDSTGRTLMMHNVGPNDDLVLYLEDGRHWHCNLNNSDGDLSNRNGIRPAADLHKRRE